MAAPAKIIPSPKAEKSDFRKRMEESKSKFLKSIENDIIEHFEKKERKKSNT